MKGFTKGQAQRVADILNWQEGLTNCLENPNRKKIVSILKAAKKPMNISEIHKKMEISYKAVYTNVEVLEKNGVVILKKNPLASGQAVTVELAPLKDRLKEIEKEVKTLMKSA